jgi:hypothetical protein
MRLLRSMTGCGGGPLLTKTSSRPACGDAYRDSGR